MNQAAPAAAFQLSSSGIQLEEIKGNVWVPNRKDFQEPPPPHRVVCKFCLKKNIGNSRLLQEIWVRGYEYSQCVCLLLTLGIIHLK